MLTPNSIPSKEPLIRVGIILPEDDQKSLEIDLGSSKEVIIEIEGKAYKYRSKIIKINIKNDKIYLDNISCDNIKIKQINNKDFITLNKVIAGRGFHWAKYITVKLTNNLEIKIIDGNLVVINEMPIEEYLSCVATSEMSSECPDSYIEAQTIVARSWMLANVEQKHIHLGFDVCNDDCCQRFQGINNLTVHSKKAAFKTRGEVLIYKNEIVDARYSKSCGGIMEKFENLWENTPKDYMINKSDAPESFNIDLTKEKNLQKWVNTVPKSFCSPDYIKEDELHKYLGNVDEAGKYFRWTIKTDQEELVENIKEKLDLNIKSVLKLIPIKRAGSGRILEMVIKYINSKNEIQSTTIYKDYEVRRVLHKMFLFSSAIEIKTISDENSNIPSKFIFNGAGWGHGAGLCQIGGIGMSLNGYTTEQIVKHYYPGADLKKIYS